MTYETLLDKYKTQEVFIYGKSVIQIVDMETTVDLGIEKQILFTTQIEIAGV